MNRELREAIYRRQTGGKITPRQRRRIRHKANRTVAIRRGTKGQRS